MTMRIAAGYRGDRRQGATPLGAVNPLVAAPAVEDDVRMESITDIHDLIIVGSGAAVVEASTVARLHGLHPMVVPMIPTRVDLLHRPLRVWDGERELRGRAVVIATDNGPLPAVYRDWLAHDRYGRLVTAENSTRTNVEGVFAAGRQAAAEALQWLGSAHVPEPVAA
jgi:thioredoxin reductase